jgi:hypothetical protein
VRVMDGITPQIGESMNIQVVFTMGAHGQFTWHLLDLAPLTAKQKTHGRTGSPKVTDRTDLFALHNATNLVEGFHRTEKMYGLTAQDMHMRFAVHAGDGLLEGPFSWQIGRTFAEAGSLPTDFPWGALDDFHAVEKAGGHADFCERGLRGENGLIHKFHKVTRRIRELLNFGVGKVISRAIASKYGVPWRSPAAGRSNSTRTVMYENTHVSTAFIANVPVAAASMVFKLREAIENTKRASAQKGRKVGPICGLKSKDAKAARKVGNNLLEPNMLLFLHLRIDHRDHCLLPYGRLAQTHDLSGMSKLLAASQTDARMSMQRAAIAGLKGVGVLLHCLASSAAACLLCLF